jgi:hypothetical protein
MGPVVTIRTDSFCGYNGPVSGAYDVTARTMHNSLLHK